MDSSLLATFLLTTLSLLANVTFGDAKGGGGGGGGGGGKSSVSKSSSSGTKGGSGSGIIYVGGGSYTHSSEQKCIDSVTRQPVPCPNNHKRNIIIIAVVCSVVGAILFGLLAWFFIRRRSRNKREHMSKTIPVPPLEAEIKKEYTKLEDKSDA